MPSQITDVLQKLRSTMARSGIFVAVAGAEPTNTPGAGLTAAVFFTSHHPAELVLDAISTLYVYTMRIYTDQLASPAEDIEDRVVTATDQVFDLLAGDPDIGGMVREIDFMGQFGVPVSAVSGYIEIDKNPNSRIVDVIIPLVVNDTMRLT